MGGCCVMLAVLLSLYMYHVYYTNQYGTKSRVFICCGQMFGPELGEVSSLSHGLAGCLSRSGTCEEMSSSQSAV